MIVTIKDLAKEAGVSLGTVSNVLNGKNGVSLDKIEKVQRAIDKLGYQRNIQAVNLKRGISNKIAIILPNIIEMKYSYLYENLNLNFQEDNFILELYLSYNKKEKEREIIKRIKEENYLFVISDSCVDNAKEYGNLLEKCLFIYRNIDGGKNIIRFDYTSVIDHYIQHWVREDIKQGIIIKDEFSDFSQEDYAYLMTKAIQENIKLEFIEQHKNSHLLAFELAQSENHSMLFTTSFETAKLIHNAYYFSNKPFPKIYTFYRNNFNNDTRFRLYGLDYGYISKKILAYIRKENTAIEPFHFSFLDFLPQNRDQNKNNIIKILAVNTPSIDALKKLIPHFTKLTNIQVHIDTCTFADMPNELGKNTRTNQYDMVRIDMESLPYFAQSYLLPLDFLTIETLEAHFSASIIQKFCQFQQKIYAVPFDPSIQMLFYRKDIFEDAKIKRLFYEKYNKELTLPTNFEQFNLLLHFFQSGVVDYPEIKKGSALIIDDEGTLASEFFVRYYANFPSIFKNGNILFNRKAVEESLSQLKTLYENAIRLEKSWWKDESELFQQGEIPLLLVYMNHFSPISNHNSLYPVGFTSVPNQRPLLGGGSLAILKQTPNQTACEWFISWFLQHIIQEQYSQLGGVSARNDLMDNQSITQSLPWLALAKQTKFYGIRENVLGDQAIHLRQIETIIGKAVKDYLLKDRSEVATAEFIQQQIDLL
ncbi:extracellular solute-binding protein [Rodentibacter genomosp. 1]|uniref:extracellular solute-binding protein n=1 Tax=Rodentibacter genomosp. 1 TaxID=1908264 RepID=UPI0009872AA7|nr:extracellular solute-binding protein [Rodentibacter genomosp. 1]